MDTAFWSLTADDACRATGSGPGGLTTDAARSALAAHGPNTLQTGGRKQPVQVLLNQFRNPVTLLLLGAAILSFFLRDSADAIIIIGIVLVSSLLGFWQEYRADTAVAQLLAMVRVTATVLRDGKEQELPLEALVPGDVVSLRAGDLIPADCLLLSSKELFVDEAAFTGETFPVDKLPGIFPAETMLSQRRNAVFMGSHVVSGSATALVMQTGAATEFGRLSASLRNQTPPTEFETGIRRFGYLLLQITLVLVVVIFGINVFLHKPVLDSFLFTLAIAVGLTPQLLPAVITVNLATGARHMAKQQVIVKRLTSIENFGSMEVLCSDKTGTLTEGKVQVHEATDCAGRKSDRVLRLAAINACLQQGFRNPIDEAIAHVAPDLTGVEKRDEIPYDFIRKRLTLLVQTPEGRLLVSKGAVNNILEVCSQAEDAAGNSKPIGEVSGAIHEAYQDLSARGFRTLGVAYRTWTEDGPIAREDEKDFTFAGFVTLFDPPKAGIADTLAELKDLGVHLKVITGDNLLIAKSLSTQIGMTDAVLLSGPEIKQLSDAALRQRALRTDVFAEVEPNEKERIILALKKSGKTVGYMGDGINDAAALHAADVGISVESAVDVAKDAADIVLMNQDLNVLLRGVKEGRRTFANTQKYVFLATSANFGNMFSMAGASLFLTFLPLLPKQILLTNLLTDFPGMSLSSDWVDENWIRRPRKWDIAFIRRFMIVFGLLSSVFDYMTFGVLLKLFHAGETEFQTGWFVESVISATLIVLVVRTRGPFYRSKPGRYLLLATLAVVLVVLVLPLTPLAAELGFAPLPVRFYPALLGIVVAYIAGAEMVKRWFYRRYR